MTGPGDSMQGLSLCGFRPLLTTNTSTDDNSGTERIKTEVQNPSSTCPFIHAISNLVVDARPIGLLRKQSFPEICVKLKIKMKCIFYTLIDTLNLLYTTSSNDQITQNVSLCSVCCVLFCSLAIIVLNIQYFVIKNLIRPGG